MALKDYLENLEKQKIDPKKEMIDKISIECGVDISTVYRWISGRIVPDKLKQEKVSEITGLPIDELFNTKTPEDVHTN